MKIDYSEFFRQLETTPLAPWIEQLPERIAHSLRHERHGLLTQWEELLDQLPTVESSAIDLKDSVCIQGATIPKLETLLKKLHPWRKGPFQIHDVKIDTEWRSDWKWNRVRPHLQPLDGRTVLDVGCGNGYHGWRMVGDGAKLVVGIDPAPLFVCQFFALKHFIQNPQMWVLPLGIEELPLIEKSFDTIFSMGVLYHRKSPLEHLEQLAKLLRPGGELIIETLVVDDPQGYSLTPAGRYAKMRNVWFIPSVQTLEYWMKRSGLTHIRTVDVTITSPDEQRSTDWMTFDSLPTFLDPNDPTKTIEGYPAPRRAITIAQTAP